MHSVKFLLILLALLFIIPPPLQAKPLTIKFSHVVAKDTPKGKAAEFFKQQIEERSGGRIHIIIYPYATLYGDRAALSALQLNDIQLAAPGFSKFIDHTLNSNCSSCPFSFATPNTCIGFWTVKLAKSYCNKGLLSGRRTHYRTSTLRDSIWYSPT